MAQLYTPPYQNALDANGNPVSGGRLYFYVSGSLTPATVYADADLETPLAFPVEADSAGRFPAIFLDPAISYRVREFDADGVLIRDTDPIGGGSAADLPYTRGATARTVAAALSDFLPHAFDAIPAAQHAAIIAGTSTYDATADLQSLIDAHNGFRLPDGVIRVNAVEGLVLKHGTRIGGNGPSRSILYALAGGGSLAQLLAHQRGSILRRAYSPGVSNAYVQHIHLSDFAVVLNHPTGAVTTTAIQIAFDFRHITRSLIERVFAGNIAPIGSILAKSSAGSFDVQGYGVVFGNVSDDDPGYCGGEVNTIRDSYLWQLYRGVTIDDNELSPPSAAYKTTVQNCDVQGCHDAIIQQGQFGALNLFEGNTVQNLIRQPGNGAPTTCYRLDGQNSRIVSGYVEAGSAADRLFIADTASRGNYVWFGGYSFTNDPVVPITTLIQDLGTHNEIHYAESSGIEAGVLDGRGKRIVMINRVADPGQTETLTLTGNGQEIPATSEVITVSGGTAPRTGITLAAPRHIGQEMTISNNSTAFTFAASGSGVIWGEAGPPTMSNAAGDVMTLELTATASGWQETGRTYRAGSTAITDPTGGTTIDTQARTAIGDILDVLRSRGMIV